MAHKRGSNSNARGNGHDQDKGSSTWRAGSDQEKNWKTWHSGAGKVATPLRSGNGSFGSQGNASEGNHTGRSDRASGEQGGGHVAYPNALKDLLRRNNIDEAWTVLEELQQQGKPADKFTLSRMLMKTVGDGRSRLNLQKVYRGIDLVEQFISNQPNDVDEVLFNALLDTCCRLKDIARLEGVLRHMRALEVRPSAVTLGILVKTYGQAGDMQRVVEVWDEMREQRHQANAVTYGCMMDACVKCGNLSKAVDVFEEMKSEKKHRNTILYTTLIKGYGAEKDLQSALALFEEMRTEGVPYNTVTYNSIIDVAVRCSERELAENLLNQMLEEVKSGDSNEAGPQPDLITFSTLLKGYCHAGQMTEAMRIADTIKQRGLRCDELVYNTLIDGCVKTNDLAMGIAFFQEMAQAGVQPSAITHSILLRLYKHAGYVQDAVEAVGLLYQHAGLELPYHIGDRGGKGNTGDRSGKGGYGDRPGHSTGWNAKENAGRGSPPLPPGPGRQKGGRKGSATGVSMSSAGSSGCSSTSYGTSWGAPSSHSRQSSGSVSVLSLSEAMGVDSLMDTPVSRGGSNNGSSRGPSMYLPIEAIHQGFTGSDAGTPMGSSSSAGTPTLMATQPAAGWMMQSIDMQGPSMQNSNPQNIFGQSEAPKTQWHSETHQQGMTFMPVTMTGNCDAAVSKYATPGPISPVKANTEINAMALSPGLSPGMSPERLGGCPGTPEQYASYPLNSDSGNQNANSYGDGCLVQNNFSVAQTMPAPSMCSVVGVPVNSCGPWGPFPMGCPPQGVVVVAGPCPSMHGMNSGWMEWN
eukprot:gnl/MRDRNA2_/MRDRNA2_28675_c0_seq1.p1 gnl/MRDRNA2_/MRDRNA2_28675_c0~~gnl/MRDRNA2_/MRDRNA2_28675_c0_seq1.p1  ORF type:complete len:854 (+),score=160.01 gnl/MRDRNA2_/MRDRNA2_28675_c0_seq1:149-2563(+)